MFPNCSFGLSWLDLAKVPVGWLAMNKVMVQIGNGTGWFL